MNRPSTDGMIAWYIPTITSIGRILAYKEGSCFAPMGCRSCLSPWYDENGKAKYWGRFNKGVVTVNLPEVACSALGNNYAKDMDSFWKNFDEVLEL